MNVNEMTVIGVSSERPTSDMKERIQPFMFTRSVGTTRDLGMVRPVVSCDSINSWAQTNQFNGSDIPLLMTPNAETIWSLNHRIRSESTVPQVLSSSSRRNTNFDDHADRRRSFHVAVPVSSEVVATSSEQQPPQVIVFINSGVKRQRRRSSFCSQITMDGAINDDEDDYDDDDYMNASLDIEDVLTEIKRFKKTNDDSSTSSSSSSSCNSMANNISRPTTSSWLLQHNNSTAVQVQSVVRNRFEWNVPVRAKVPRRGSTNNARHRWMQQEKIHEPSMICDSSPMSDAVAYDDDSEDSSENHSRNNLIRRVTSLQLIGQY